MPTNCCTLKTSADVVKALNPDGIFLSNGPGDPQPCDYQLNRSPLLEDKKPIFGICLGHQLLGLAAGAKKLKKCLLVSLVPIFYNAKFRLEKVFISSQNHGFEIDEKIYHKIFE